MRKKSKMYRKAETLKFLEWYGQHYDKGKMLVDNPNPETREQFPKVQSDTAMKNDVFRKDLAAKYKAYRSNLIEQEKQKSQSSDDAHKDQPPHHTSDPSIADLSKGTVMQYGLFGNTHYLEVSSVNPDKKRFKARKLNRETGKPFGKTFDVSQKDIHDNKIRIAVPPLFPGASKGKKKSPAKTKPKVEKTPVADNSPSEVIDVDSGDYKQVGPQGGSNPGGKYQDADGVEWYVKTPKTEEHARNEILAGKLYELAGVEMPELRAANRDGKFSVASKIIPGLREDSEALKTGKGKGALEGVAADAWLANWDVVGLVYDNMLLTDDDEVRRVDTGGALRYRAMGSPKGGSFGHKVTEFDIFFNPDFQSGSVFANATPEQVGESIERVLKVSDSEIKKMTDQWGPKDDDTRDELYETLVARKKYLKDNKENIMSKAEKMSKSAGIERRKVAREVLRFAEQDPKFRRAFFEEMRRIVPPRDMAVDPESLKVMLAHLRAGDLVRVAYREKDGDAATHVVRPVLYGYNEPEEHVKIGGEDDSHGLLCKEEDGVVLRPGKGKKSFPVLKMTLVKSAI